jgi:RNA binding exosome subunit
MAGVPFHYVDLRAFCYVTEDEKRVESALRTFVPEEFEVERAASEGHHGDRILVLSARVETADEMRTVLDSLRELSDAEFEQLLGELEERVDDNCAFYLTFDKQAAFGGDVQFGDGVTFRAKVEAYPADPETAVENARAYFQGLDR